MEDFILFLEGRVCERAYTKIAGPSRFSGTDSEVYLADGKIYKRFLNASETPTPVSRNILETYHRIQSVIAVKSFEFDLALRNKRVIVSVLPLIPADVLETRGVLVSRSSFIAGKTLSEESIAFEGKYGSLAQTVLRQIDTWLISKGVVLDKDESYIHPSNIKVDPNDYTRLTITDLGSKISGFVGKNRHLAMDIASS